MTYEEDIKDKIIASRKMSDDGDLVTYDLTKGIDFSRPKAVAEALSMAFFEKDAINWFQASDDKIDFKPTYKVRFVMAEGDNKKLEETVDDFLKDLKRKEIYNHFEDQVKRDSESVGKMRAAMASGVMNKLLDKHLNGGLDRSYVEDDLLTDILEKIEIRSLNDRDLMDWEHLPL
ncbi:MAG: hypothetical protein QW597_01580 [Thermoplasmataceae archaeon]